VRVRADLAARQHGESETAGQRLQPRRVVLGVPTAAELPLQIDQDPVDVGPGVNRPGRDHHQPPARPQHPAQHGLGQVHADDVAPTVAQLDRDNTGADAELEGPAVSGEQRAQRVGVPAATGGTTARVVVPVGDPVEDQ
jgi:hypothetical protein